MQPQPNPFEGPSQRETPQEAFVAKTRVIERALAMGDIYGQVELAEAIVKNTTELASKNKAIGERNIYIGEAYVALWALSLAINHLYKKDEEYKKFLSDLRTSQRDNLNILWNLMAQMDGFLNKAGILEYGREPSVKELLERYV